MINDMVTYFSGTCMVFLQYNLYNQKPSSSIRCHFTRHSSHMGA